MPRVQQGLGRPEQQPRVQQEPERLLQAWPQRPALAQLPPGPEPQEPPPVAERVQGQAQRAPRLPEQPLPARGPPLEP